MQEHQVAGREKWGLSRVCSGSHGPTPILELAAASKVPGFGGLGGLGERPFLMLIS